MHVRYFANGRLQLTEARNIGVGFEDSDGKTSVVSDNYVMFRGTKDECNAVVESIAMALMRGVTVHNIASDDNKGGTVAGVNYNPQEVHDGPPGSQRQ